MEGWDEQIQKNTAGKSASSSPSLTCSLSGAASPTLCPSSPPSWSSSTTCCGSSRTAGRSPEKSETWHFCSVHETQKIDLVVFHSLLVVDNITRTEKGYFSILSNLSRTSSIKQTNLPDTFLTMVIQFLFLWQLPPSFFGMGVTSP